MNDQCEALCEQLARCIVEKDFDGVHALLAPWLRDSISPTQIREMVDTVSEGLAHPPHTWTIDEGMAELADLRKPDGYGPPSQGISTEITDGNFRGWLSILFAPEPSVYEEQNVCYELWVVAIEHNGRVLAGYLEAAEAS